MDSGQESELIAKCRRGDEAAWNALFDLHYDAVGRFVYQLSGNFNREDTEEICQEVFLTVIRSLNTFRGNSQLQTWIFRIAANKSRDYLARQNAAKRGGGHVPLPLHPTGEVGPDELPPLDPPSPAPAPDAQLDRSPRTSGEPRHAGTSRWDGGSAWASPDGEPSLARGEQPLPVRTQERGLVQSLARVAAARLRQVEFGLDDHRVAVVGQCQHP